MIELKDEWFKHFRTFLKTNGFYKDFMECFSKQAYEERHHGLENQFRPNYIKVMRRDSSTDIMQSYEEFGAMIFTFASFIWVKGGAVIPLEFTVKWCTVAFKWGLYCVKNKLEICSMERFIQLYNYWNAGHWIDDDMLTEEEENLLEDIKEEVKLEKLINNRI
jgi:hypothetical protein